MYQWKNKEHKNILNLIKYIMWDKENTILSYVLSMLNEEAPMNIEKNK